MEYIHGTASFSISRFSMIARQRKKVNDAHLENLHENSGGTPGLSRHNPQNARKLSGKTDKIS
ncbi:MAG: hypothetical protein HFF67_05410 [Oscillospiraceae bacterium]|nr:hypothetical protein [Oscillospiraceae bacterium]MDE6935855.1 hypothetical protein [Oscillospiraceae bacterium]